MDFQQIVDGGRLALGGIADFASNLAAPRIRLGVTGLSRSGKTVFITALVHALLKQSRMPVFEVQSEGRITAAYLEPQPDDDLPRFAYEDHLTSLQGEKRKWPEGTKRISQLRLTLEYQPLGFLARTFGSGKLHVDIVDYPGEWLLDLPLMRMSYAQWSAATMAASRVVPRNTLATAFHAELERLRATGPAREEDALSASAVFTQYLSDCRKDDVALSSLPPGRFLMPGDLAGSPLLTFSPLDIEPDAEIVSGSLASLMAKRYDSYVAKVVKPFYFGHFARLDRQIVLVDALTALNAGSTAVSDLRSTLADVLASFRIGVNTAVSAVVGRRIDKVLFAATKADLLHHSSHDRLQSILDVLVSDAVARAQFEGATVSSVALSAIRATREAVVRQKTGDLSCIVGVPEKFEKIGDQVFDGETEAAIFPGDLPLDPASALNGDSEGKLRFVKFRPPLSRSEAYAHVRLDRALEFLLGDRFP